MSSVQGKIFTPEDANRTLPLVSSIVADILKAGNEMKSMSKETMTGDHAAKLEERIATLKSYLKEMDELGCTFKDWDFKTGLVDFPGELNGEPIILSWRSDEPAVTHYYRMNESHRQRRPLPGLA